MAKKKVTKKPVKKVSKTTETTIVASEITQDSPFLERDDIVVITDSDSEGVDPSQPTLFIDVEIIDNDDEKEPEVKTSVFEAYVESDSHSDDDEVIVQSDPLFPSSDEVEPNQDTYISDEAKNSLAKMTRL